MYIPRAINTLFQKLVHESALIAIVGARQAGKTTFLKEQLKGKNSAYLLFDDPDIRALFEEDIKKFEQQYLAAVDVAVLDEVQQCRDAGQKLKYLAEQGKRLWITSSSELLLGKKILSYLVGRISILRLYPFSLAEFLIARGQKETTVQILKRLIWEHFTYGGYPKIVLATDSETKQIMLRDLHETMILKDIANTFSIEDIRTLEEFSKYIAHNVGNVFSYDTAARVMKSSFPTLKKYLDAMEKSYLILRIPPYYTNKNKEISKQPKIYFVDSGLRNAIIRTFAPNPEGKLFENYVLSELLKAGFSPKYWRTKTKVEIDFVIDIEGETIPIECKLTANPDTIERNLRSFISAYRPSRAFVVAYEPVSAAKTVGDCCVVFCDIKALLESLFPRK